MKTVGQLYGSAFRLTVAVIADTITSEMDDYTLLRRIVKVDFNNTLTCLDDMSAIVRRPGHGFPVPRVRTETALVRFESEETRSGKTGDVYSFPINRPCPQSDSLTGLAGIRHFDPVPKISHIPRELSRAFPLSPDNPTGARL